MLVKTTRFGEIDVKDEDIITFNEGIPGLEHLKSFCILSHYKNVPFKWLQSLDDMDIALVVINPYLYLSDYNFTLEEDVLDQLNINNAEDVAVFIVAVIPEDVKKMTANFIAPIIINAENKLGKQIILMNSEYQVRTPIYELYLNVKAQEAV